MAGHSKFKNIMHRKGAQDKKRAKLFSRLIREISVSVKLGSPDPDSNPRLRTAINNALSSNMNKDSIDKAIKAGLDLDGTKIPEAMLSLYEEVMEKEAARICRVRVAMRKKVVSTGVRHYDRETLNQKLLEAGWEGLKAAEIAYYYS